MTAFLLGQFGEGAGAVHGDREHHVHVGDAEGVFEVAQQLGGGVVHPAGSDAHARLPGYGAHRCETFVDPVRVDADLHRAEPGLAQA